MLREGAATKFRNWSIYTIKIILYANQRYKSGVDSDF